jgi:hypothetical protein
MQMNLLTPATIAEAKRTRTAKAKGGCLQGIVPRTFDLIHYGADKYLPEKFLPICDAEWVKPKGGLWTSPVNSEYGWREWCEAESFNLGSLKKSFRVKFSGRVMTIDSVRDMEQLPWCEPTPGWNFPLWEAVEFCGVDAIHLTVKGQNETRFSRPHNLYGWDCETVLVMNRACVSPWN